LSTGFGRGIPYQIREGYLSRFREGFVT